MKKLLVLLFVFVGVSSMAQSPYKYLKLENRDLVFERVYELDSMPASEVEKLLIASVPTAKNVYGYSNSSNVITAKIEGAMIDYRMYGGRPMSVVTYMNFPFYAGVSIEWKDNKYKVAVTNMTFRTSLGTLTGGEAFGKASGTRYDESRIALRSGEYLELYLSDLFKARTGAKKDW